MPPEPTEKPGDCPLSRAHQTRNLLIYAACMGLIYLCAPALYVGVMQAGLCRQLGASDTVANLPGSVFFGMTFMPVILAWWLPYVSFLKRNLVCCFAAVALSAGAMAVTFVLPVSNQFKIVAVIVQAGVVGVASPAAVGFLWEMIGRGVSESRRGMTLGLAFGLGPILAIVGSALQTALLGGNFLGWQLEGKVFPEGYVWLYGMAAPLIGLAALLCATCVVPLPEKEVVREPFVAGVFGGIGNILGNRLLLLAAVITVLLYVGNTIPANMNLYSELAFGESSDRFSGPQNMLRFTFKFITGLLLGWMLGKTNPRAGILLTGTLYGLAMAWAILVTGPWYILAAAIHGAGELVGVYAPNYILSASKKSQMRRNMAFVQMLMVPTAPMGAVFGSIADYFNRTAFGFRVSFALCGAFVVAGLMLTLTMLPPRPTPQED
ncbi:MAG: MFS transporter [Pirellulales bacterium]